jgi:hypothetical protein
LVPAKDQAGRDRVIAAWFNPDIVRRVGVHQVNGLASKQPIHSFRLAAVATEQTMFAEQPEVTGLRLGLVGRLGNEVRIRAAGVRLGIQQACQLRLREPRQVEVEIEIL